MTWRNVLDTKIPGSNRNAIAEIALKLGYDFICHNGQIFFVAEVNGEATVFPTSIRVESLEGWDEE